MRLDRDLEFLKECTDEDLGALGSISLRDTDCKQNITSYRFKS